MVQGLQAIRRPGLEDLPLQSREKPTLHELLWRKGQMINLVPADQIHICAGFPYGKWLQSLGGDGSEAPARLASALAGHCMWSCPLHPSSRWYTALFWLPHLPLPRGLDPQRLIS